MPKVWWEPRDEHESAVSETVDRLARHLTEGRPGSEVVYGIGSTVLEGVAVPLLVVDDSVDPRRPMALRKGPVGYLEQLLYDQFGPLWPIEGKTPRAPLAGTFEALIRRG